MFKKKYYLNAWHTFESGERVHISGAKVNGKFNPKEAYRLSNIIIDNMESRGFKVIY